MVTSGPPVTRPELVIREELLSQLADMFTAIRDFPTGEQPISAPFAIHSASPGQPLDFAHA